MKLMRRSDAVPAGHRLEEAEGVLGVRNLLLRRLIPNLKMTRLDREVLEVDL